ncbi:MAG: NAD-glutamate dehydrogenase [Deferrisomatales bacterium]|nr:NAD-glutamate dehydrogenase [Deferrisomatales bacterium]
MDARTELRVYRRFLQALHDHCEASSRSLEWLRRHMHPYFFITMADETEAVVNLASGLASLGENRRITLVDQEKKLVWACMNRPGSVYRSLLEIQDRPLSYAEITHSYHPVPELCCELEIQRFEFDRKSNGEVARAARSGPAPVPDRVRRGVSRALRALYPRFDFGELRKVLDLLWLNAERYVAVSPPERVARVLWLYQQGRLHDGLFLDAENTRDVVHHRETRLLFSVGNPDERGFLAQALEVFHRLELAVRRSYCLTLSTGVHPYFLGTFYVTTREGGLLQKDSELFRTLQSELYNTQILSTTGRTYTEFVADRVMTGEEASLTNAFIAFSHTNLAHSQPDRFDLGEVRRAFHASPDVVLQLARLFRARFDPDLGAPGAPARRAACDEALAASRALVESYNTGHRHLDEVRRTIFRTALFLVTHTLKTNFFVPEKHALAFRLDPSYLQEFEPELTADLPAGEPFRITFFYGRHGSGYHVGFSDIARGGWRTVPCTSPDDFLAAANTLFREVYVLAHTQHLKNKDIYEGGSKMVVVLDTSDVHDRELRTQRLYKLQYGFLNAFLDLFVTKDGRAAHPRVVDYYGEDEPIELGPDENMHDAMIELIARQAARRGYILGKGIISSKEVGINHKEYGVTSLGVVTMAETALAELGIDPRRDPFTVSMTGGPNGDVAGNAMRLLLARCPGVRILSIVAGSGAVYDPEGIDREELSRLVLQANVDAFDPDRLHPGGFLLLRRGRKQEGLKELYRKLVRTPAGVAEQWVTADELHRELDDLIFTVPADLFLPGGGRPETIDARNAGRLFREDGTPLVRAVVEGANSFVTPEARTELQRRGVIVLRDASANKCGVISSSYEILANLLLSDEEFLARKAQYVADVLRILEKRAGDEARLIFRRHREAGGTRAYTEISNALSGEINAHYERLFAFFLARPELVSQPYLRRVLLNHLPELVSRDPVLRRRVGRLPFKIRCAVLAVELATSIVYRGGWEPDLESSIRAYAKRAFGG